MSGAVDDGADGQIVCDAWLGDRVRIIGYGVGERVLFTTLVYPGKR